MQEPGKMIVVSESCFHYCMHSYLHSWPYTSIVIIIACKNLSSKNINPHRPALANSCVMIYTHTVVGWCVYRIDYYTNRYSDTDSSYTITQNSPTSNQGHQNMSLISAKMHHRHYTVRYSIYECTLLFIRYLIT